jgi:hypothetical protein
MNLKRRSIVPMPHARTVYGEGSKRDQLIQQYGEVSVMHAEVAVCVTVLVELGIIKKSEFAELVENALKAADIRRQRQAESGGRA